MSKKLEEYSKEELTKELARRAEIERLEVEREQKEHEDFIYENIDALLKLTPQHGKTSCDDKNHNNSDSCNRCLLLEIKEGKWNMPSNMRVRLDITWSDKCY